MLNNSASSPLDSSYEHVAIVMSMLEALTDHLREDATQFDEPKAQALFETAAEVLQGLHTAFDHYQQGTEPAMREPH
jgi:hypothetical protein